MRPVVSVAEMQAVDAAATTPVDVLIKRAGRAVANRALQMLGGAYGRRVVVVAGKGNNGADGIAAAAVLRQRGAWVDVCPPGAPLGTCDLVIDAAFGTGFRGTYDAPDTHGAPVLAVDIPSGVNGDTGVAGPGSVQAAATVTMAAWKPGLLLGEGPARAGAVTVVDIGLPVGTPAAHLMEDADRALLPPRARDAHKWARAVVIVAGSPGMRGAAALCARAAQRAGAGMVRVGSLGASEPPLGEAVGFTITGAADVLDQLDRAHALVIGPGLGRTDAARALVREIVAKADVPMVIDADGLWALDNSSLTPRVVLTPHDGEFARLRGAPPGEDRLGAVRAFAHSSEATVLLKGPTTIVAAPDGRALLSNSGGPRLATAGTGDVLAGIIGAFLAAGAPPLEAAALAAHVQGRAAERGRPGLVAGDLPDLLDLGVA